MSSSAHVSSDATAKGVDERYLHHQEAVKDVLARLKPIPEQPTDEDLADSATKGHALWDRIGRPRYVAAPMVAGSDLAFRLQVRRHGVHLAYSPMMSANVLAASGSGNVYTAKALTTTHDGSDRPLFVQIAGKTPQIVAEAGRKLEAELGEHIDAIDLNFGCPQLCARRAGYGAYVLEQEEQALALVQGLSASVRLPVTCKIRVLPRIEDTIRVARRMVMAGCAVLAVHGRTRQEKGHATANADWDAIAAVRRAVPVPVIANGGMPSLWDAEVCMRVTGAHAAMASEALLEDPAMFSRPMSATELAALPPEGLWRAVTPKPWDDTRAMHLAASSFYGNHWASFRSQPGGGSAPPPKPAAPKEAPESPQPSSSPPATPSRAGARTTWASRLGLKPVPPEMRNTAGAYLSSLPLAPPLGAGGGPAAVDLAEEYLDIAERVGLQVKEMRLHVFRFVFGLLITSPDLRRALDAGSDAMKQLWRRESRSIRAAPRKRRPAAMNILMAHLPQTSGFPTPPPVVASQLFLSRAILRRLRSRAQHGWPRLVSSSPSLPSPRPESSTTPSSSSSSSSSSSRAAPAAATMRPSPTPVSLWSVFSSGFDGLAFPSSPIAPPGQPETTTDEVVSLLLKDGSAPAWILRQHAEGARPDPVVTTTTAPPSAAPERAPQPPKDPTPHDAVTPAAPGSDSVSYERAGVGEEAASGAELPLRWSGLDEAAAAAMFRKWPATCCRDFQRRPGLPAGMDAARPGFWYWRHLCEPAGSRVMTAVSRDAAVAALESQEVEPCGAGYPRDLEDEIAAFVEGIPDRALPELLTRADGRKRATEATAHPD